MKIKIDNEPGRVEILTSYNEHFIDGLPRTKQSRLFSSYLNFGHYIDLEVFWENMNFMEDRAKIKEMMVYRIERDLEKGNNVVSIEGYENVLCIDRREVKCVFGLPYKEIYRYLVTYFVLEQKREIFVLPQFGRGGDVLKCYPVYYFRPLRGRRKGLYLSEYMWEKD